MGFYIQVPENKDKARQLVELYGAEIIPLRPTSLTDVPSDKALICVVDNGAFEAAAYAFDEREFSDFCWTPQDPRPRTWVLMDKEKAEELSGFLQRSRA